ncbi:hypothetical protein Tco_1399396, partial [Tanacetum coccineum]
EDDYREQRVACTQKKDEAGGKLGSKTARCCFSLIFIASLIGEYNRDTNGSMKRCFICVLICMSITPCADTNTHPEQKKEKKMRQKKDGRLLHILGQEEKKEGAERGRLKRRRNETVFLLNSFSLKLEEKLESTTLELMILTNVFHYIDLGSQTPMPHAFELLLDPVIPVPTELMLGVHDGAQQRSRFETNGQK